MSTTFDGHANGGAPDPPEGWPYEGELPASTRLGVSLSGGGIRSATFALGVYQRLAEAGKFQRARYLSAVSGGSYLAAGLAISHGLCPKSLWSKDPAPWARGSPEESRLRRNLSYLAPGSSGRLWLMANVLYGLILNLCPILLAAFVCGRLVGLMLRILYPGLATSGGFDVSAIPWILAADGALVLGAVAVVGHRRFREKSESRPHIRRSRSERHVTVLFSVAAVLTSLGLILPLIIHGMTRSISHDLVVDLGLSGASWHIQRIAIGLFAVMVGVVLGGTAVWFLQRRRFRVFRAVLATVAGASVVLAPFLLAAETGAARAWNLEAFAALLASVVVMLLFAVFAHNRRYSMHLFYRERIQEAFAFQRVPADGGSFEVESVPYDVPIKLTEVAKRSATRVREEEKPFPELLVCAAVAARDTEVPTKARAASFTALHG